MNAMLPARAGGYTIPAPVLGSLPSDELKRPMVLRLSEDVLEDMCKDGGKGLKLSVNGGQISLLLPGKEPLALAKQQDTSQSHFIYRLNEGEDAMSAEGSGPVGARLSIKTSSVESAAARLKEMRKEEAIKKQNSRTVMLDQAQFDKKGRLTAGAKAAPATAATATTSVSSPLLARSRSATPAQGANSPRLNSSGLGPFPKLASASTSTRGASPSSASGSSQYTPRQKILHLLAAGPQTRDYIIKGMPTSEPSAIIRLLPLIAVPTEGGDASKMTGATLLTLKDELYKEVATAIGTNTWPAALSTDEIKDDISTKAIDAFGRLKMTTKAAEWKAILKWTGQLEEVRPTQPKRKDFATSTASGSQARRSTSVTSSVSPEPDQKPKAKGKVASTTRERLKRAVKGKGPRGEELRKEQEKQRQKLERSRTAAASTASDNDTAASSRSQDDTAASAVAKKRQRKDEAGGSEPSKPAVKTEEWGRRAGSASKSVAEAPSASQGKKRKSEEAEEKDSKAASGVKAKSKAETPVRASGAASQGKKRKSDEADEDESQPVKSAKGSKAKAEAQSLSSGSVSPTKKRKSEAGTEKDSVLGKSAAVVKAKVAETRPSGAAPQSQRRRPVPDYTSSSAEEDSIPERRSPIQRKTPSTASSPPKPTAVRLNSTPVAPTPQIKQHPSEELEDGESSEEEGSIPETRRTRTPSPKSSVIDLALNAHHGPSASASLINAEPWLDVRTSEEWTRLAHRFQRVWTQYSELTSLLEAEKQRLHLEREKAAGEDAQPRRINPEEELEEGEMSEDDQALSDDFSMHTIEDGQRYAWRGEESGETFGGATAAPASPMSFEELARLVQNQKSVQGELKRMKEALQGWTDRHPEAVAV